MTTPCPRGSSQRHSPLWRQSLSELSSVQTTHVIRLANICTLVFGSKISTHSGAEGEAGVERSSDIFGTTHAQREGPLLSSRVVCDDCYCGRLLSSDKQRFCWHLQWFSVNSRLDTKVNFSPIFEPKRDFGDNWAVLYAELLCCAESAGVSMAFSLSIDWIPN